MAPNIFLASRSFVNCPKMVQPTNYRAKDAKRRGALPPGLKPG
jgi:hypothetical protein